MSSGTGAVAPVPSLQIGHTGSGPEAFLLLAGFFFLILVIEVVGVFEFLVFLSFPNHRIVRVLFLVFVQTVVSHAASYSRKTPAKPIPRGNGRDGEAPHV
jgi:hypothetical protein